MKNESPNTRLEQLQKMLQASPKDAFIAYVLGLEYQKINDQAKAIECFDLALLADANYLAAYYQKAISLAESTQTQAAVDTLTEGLLAAKAQGDTKTQAEMNNLRMNLLIELD